MSSSLALLAWKTYYIYYATNNPPPPPIPLPPAQLIKIVKTVLLLDSVEFTEKCENSVKTNIYIYSLIFGTVGFVLKRSFFNTVMNTKLT